VSHDLIARVREAATQSELVHAVSSIRRDGGRAFALGGVPLRPLCEIEIGHLERLGNSCADWSRLRVADGFDWRRVRHCTFYGDVLLGRFTRDVSLADGATLPSGLSHATVSNCVIGNNVFITDVKLLANYVVGEEAVLLNCGMIHCDGRTAFGNGATLSLGVESSGREVAVYAEVDSDLAATVARSRGQHEFLQQYAQAVHDYTSQVISNRGIIERRAVICSTPKVHNAYVGPHARIDGATLVEDSTLLSSPDEPVRVESGACVTGSLLQWGSQVSTLAIVDRSVLSEHSHAERHGKVAQSLLGPNTGVAKGEVTASLLGPFVGFHHQALLIATLWPEGKGNVAYGANAGANHTSKAPDQEFWPGEGMHLGLGVNIKFPANFTKAPYTIIACGVTTLPQKVLFPFSLVNLPSTRYPDISPAYNEIIPAWLLTDNLYALKRNEHKHQARNRARRKQFDFRIFRLDIVDLMRDACRRLQAVRAVKEVYTDEDIEGLGKNLLLEKNRKRAIESYQFFVRYYALLRLKGVAEVALRDNRNGVIKRLLVTSSADPEWEHARQILCDEMHLCRVADGLRLLPAMLEQIARGVERSKARDDERGPQIIDDYADVHSPAADDPFVRQTWDETHLLVREIEDLVGCLENAQPVWNGTGRLNGDVKRSIAESELHTAKS
jgi:hypothetical protein